jgi:hypothetical protein
VPGDDQEAVDWMDGLSSRLSAYSLNQDDAPPSAEDDAADTPDTPDDPDE